MSVPSRAVCGSVSAVHDPKPTVPSRTGKPRDVLSWPLLVVGPVLALGLLVTAVLAYANWMEIADLKCEAGHEYLATETVLESRAIPPRYVCLMEYPGEDGSPAYPTRTVTYDAAPTALAALAFGLALALYTAVIWRALRPLRWPRPRA